MDKSETKKAIQFFHDISLIMHFDTPKLRDSVIIDTKPVLLTLSECYRLGDSLEMDKSETEKAIQFFHDISLIMHSKAQRLVSLSFHRQEATRESCKKED